MKRGDGALLLSAETGTKSPDNAALYQEAYGREEPVAELIPAMLARFLDSDRAFAKAGTRLSVADTKH